MGQLTVGAFACRHDEDGEVHQLNVHGMERQQRVQYLRVSHGAGSLSHRHDSALAIG